MDAIIQACGDRIVIAEHASWTSYTIQLRDCTVVIQETNGSIYLSISALTFHDSGKITAEKLAEIAAIIPECTLGKLIATADMHYCISDRETCELISAAKMPMTTLFVCGDIWWQFKSDDDVWQVVPKKSSTKMIMKTYKKTRTFVLTYVDKKIAESFHMRFLEDAWPEKFTHSRLKRKTTYICDWGDIYHFKFTSRQTELFRAANEGQVVWTRAQECLMLQCGDTKHIATEINPFDYYVYPPVKSGSHEHNFGVIFGGTFTPIELDVNYNNRVDNIASLIKQYKYTRVTNGEVACAIYPPAPEECSICMDDVATWSCMRCRQTYACDTCNKKIAACPLCRADF